VAAPRGAAIRIRLAPPARLDSWTDAGRDTTHWNRAEVLVGRVLEARADTLWMRVASVQEVSAPVAALGTRTRTRIVVRPGDRVDIISLSARRTERKVIWTMISLVVAFGLLLDFALSGE
jgi:hypothetical protein